MNIFYRGKNPSFCSPSFSQLLFWLSLSVLIYVVVCYDMFMLIRKCFVSCLPFLFSLIFSPFLSLFVYIFLLFISIVLILLPMTFPYISLKHITYSSYMFRRRLLLQRINQERKFLVMMLKTKPLTRVPLSLLLQSSFLKPLSNLHV